MNLQIVFFLTFFHAIFGERVYYDTKKGFELIENGTENNVLLNCVNSDFTDVTLHVWDINPPPKINKLTIANCDTLRLQFACNLKYYTLREITIVNITNLFIIPVSLSRLAQKITFQNISKIESIPRGTFHTHYDLSNTNCFKSNVELETLVFKDVSIDYIEMEAFQNLTNIKLFSWEGVNVHRINTEGVQVTLAKNSLGFEIKKSSLGVLEPLAIHLLGYSASLINNKFLELHSSAINGTFSQFVFNENTVGAVHAGAISVLSQNTFVLDNSFEYLHSGALKRIGPGLLSGIFFDFGKLKFRYIFKNNAVSYADVGSLHPDLEAFNNVAAEIVFTYNALQCSCENLSWLASDIGLGKGYSPLKDFHKSILDPANHNICIYTPCVLPIEVLREGLMNQDCEKFLSEDEICTFYNRTPQIQFQQRSDWSVSGSIKMETATSCVFLFLLFLHI